MSENQITNQVTNQIGGAQKYTPTSDAPTNDVLLKQAADWYAGGHKVALAIVMQTWGSSPRPVGSVMVVRGDMEFAGSVSGGCVESAVIDAAMHSMETGVGERLDFGVADATAWEVGLSCGGQIAVLITPIMAAGQSGLSGTVLTQMAAGIDRRETVRLCLDARHGGLVDDAGDNARDNARDNAGPNAGPNNETGLDDRGERFVFIQRPPRRLLIVGAVHISQFLAPIAAQTGFDVMVIDPRAAFTGGDRFAHMSGVTCHTGWPDDVMADVGLDANCAVVTLTHDPKIDDPGLQAALAHPVYYIAALGSRKTHAARCERLAVAGFNADDIARIHGPAGLDIGAKTPAEIAISILGELIAAERLTQNAQNTQNTRGEKVKGR